VKTVLKKGKLIHSQNLISDTKTEIQELEQGKIRKYLGLEESEGRHQQNKERLKKEYTRILRMILKSKLNAKNKITTCGALAPQY
jgi:hypothetical protein